jgi:predicted nucleic acid-binding protein
MADFFADTYAIIEILKGNRNYERYANLELATTEFNLLELSYALVRDYGKSKALELLSDVGDSLEIVKVSYEDFVNASEFRLQSKKEGKKLSLIDCLGYVVAKRLGVKFLTGDEEFRDLENVEFVK